MTQAEADDEQRRCLRRKITSETSRQRETEDIPENIRRGRERSRTGPRLIFHVSVVEQPASREDEVIDRIKSHADDFRRSEKKSFSFFAPVPADLPAEQQKIYYNRDPGVSPFVDNSVCVQLAEFASRSSLREFGSIQQTFLYQSELKLHQNRISATDSYVPNCDPFVFREFNVTAATRLVVQWRFKRRSFGTFRTRFQARRGKQRSDWRKSRSEQRDLRMKAANELFFPALSTDNPDNNQDFPDDFPFDGRGYLTDSEGEAGTS